jgi:hypothetical protein
MSRPRHPAPGIGACPEKQVPHHVGACCVRSAPPDGAKKRFIHGGLNARPSGWTPLYTDSRYARTGPTAGPAATTPRSRAWTRVAGPPR